MVPILLSALAMTLIVGLRYLATSGFFAWLTRRVRPGLYDKLTPQIGREIYWSLLSASIYGIPAGIVAWGWDNRGGRKYTAMHRIIRSGIYRCRCCYTSPPMTPGFTGHIG